MNNPKDYADTNNFCKIDIKNYLENVKDHLKWVDGENILDIGCGDGCVTLEALVPNLPKNYNRLVACDVSKEMIEFARNRKTKEKVQFLELNVVEKIPDKLREQFHHVFSFYCLQMVPNQRIAFENMYKIMKPNGQIFVVLIANTPQIDAHVALSKTSKWAPLLSNYHQILSPYQYSKDPCADLENTLAAVGFTCKFSILKNGSEPYSKRDFEKFVCSLSPYVNNLVGKEREEFVKDFLEEIKKQKTIEIRHKDDEEIYVFKYKTLQAFAVKQ